MLSHKNQRRNRNILSVYHYTLLLHSDSPFMFIQSDNHFHQNCIASEWISAIWMNAMLCYVLCCVVYEIWLHEWGNILSA